MTKKPVGIVDPWRTVDPLHPAPKPPPTPGRRRIDLSEIDLDADLAIPGTYTLRFKHASFHITSTRLKTSADALGILVDSLMALIPLRDMASALRTAGIGIRQPTHDWNVPPANTPASTLATATQGLWFTGVDLDTGTLQLARIIRHPLAANTLRRHGIVVMLTSS